MKRPSSLPVVVQVGALAAAAVIASQAVAFAVVLLSPDPEPDGFNVAAAAEALRGRPARTSDGRALRRRISDQPPADSGVPDPVQRIIVVSLAEQLQIPTDRIRVKIDTRRPESGWREGERPRVFRFSSDPEDQGPVIIRRDRQEAGEIETQTVITVLGPSPAAPPPGPPPAPTGPGEPALPMVESTRTFDFLTHRLSFAPFTASFQLDDGRWATVEPPRGWLSPWQQRILLALSISVLLMAPLVWWMARRLTQPIRVFAHAAERLGADPDADPMAPSGPSEVRTAIVAFNDMQASIRAHMRQRTQTIAAIAHDLRTPLTRLRFRAEQAPEGVRDRMASDIEEMDALIAQAMAFVRGDRATERREAFDLAALSADCAGGFAETGADVRFDGGAPLAVVGDPAALRRAISNLIDNALKFAGQARVRAFAADGRAVVEVEDDGPGLPEAELEIVFEPFHRGERSRSRETGGAGLGLSVARQAARAAGGEVTLSRRNGGGLTARLHLPLAASGTDAPGKEI